MTLDPLWTSAEITRAVNGRTPAKPFKVRGVSIDTRTIRSDDLFVALKGEASDGHDYIKAALDAGAAGILADHVPEGIDESRIVLSRDTMRALAALGRAARARTQASVVAVTGSVGKTGTKEALKAALGRYRPAHASALSYNNDIGVPLSLSRMPQAAEFGIFEMGMNHAGELTRLSLMARPNVALITTVESAHIEFFDSIAAIADAKAEVFAGVERNGTAILNRDNDQYRRLRDAASDYSIENILTFGFDEAADIRILRHARHEDCSCITADVAGQTMTYKVGMPGRHWVMNSLGVLATVLATGGDLGLAGLALAELAAVEGRGQRREVRLGDMPGARILVIDESYNANPASMRAALETLGQANIEQITTTARGARINRRGRRIAVLGDMGELGRQSDRMHGELVTPVIKNGIDLVYTVGPHMAHLDDALPPEKRGRHVKAAKDMIKHLLPEIQNGDVIMVKGSKATGMGMVVKALLALEDGGEKQAQVDRRESRKTGGGHAV